MASNLYSQVTANRDANRKWSDITVKDLLWNETSERVKQLIKAKEVSQDSIKSSVVFGELEVDLIFSSEPSTESLEDSLECVLDLQRNGSSYDTRFSAYYIEALLNTIRHIKATCLFKTNEKKQSIKKTKKKVPEASPLVEIGIKTGLAFFLNLLKRSSYIEGANELLTDMLSSMNDILSEFEPLTLYKNPIPAVGKTSLDKIVHFLQSHEPTHKIAENRELSISLLTNLTLQRGSLSSVLQCIQFIYSLDDVPVPKSTFTKLIQFFRTIVNELEEKIKGGSKDSDQNSENSENKLENKKRIHEDRFLDELCSEFDNKNNSYIQSHLIAFLILGYCKEFSSLLLTPSSSSSSSGKDNKQPSNTNTNITPRVFVCGSNSYGQIGADRPTASESEEFASLNPLQVVAGCDCTFLLDQDGVMWARGKGDYGRLGTGDSNSVSSFKKMSGFNVKITYFCASQGSYGHGLALDENGDVWSWGDGDYGKLGHGTTDQTPVPTIIQALRGKDVKRVSVGWKHSSAVTESGEVYTWGIGDSRLGFSNESQRSLPEKIMGIMCDYVVKFTVCGDSHMFAVCDEGNVVFGWGDNSYGKIGTGSSSTSVPERITALDNLGIVQMACGEHHSLALTSKGEVYAWGISPACGLSSNTPTPTILDDLSGQKVTHIAASSTHSFAIVSSGSVYGWGSSDNGGPGVSNALVPTIIDSLEDCQIKQISGGFSHSVFINIPSIYSSSTGSCLTPVEKSPFAIDLTKEAFATLYNLLKTFENNWNLQKPFKTIENQSYYMEACLNILRANLYHANATKTNLAEIGLDPENSQILEFFREFLLHVLQTDHVSQQIKQISKNIFEDCWELLLPSLSLRISMLNNLLPKSNDDILKYSETESFLLGVIISSLIKSTKFAEYLHLDSTKISSHTETPFEADYSNLIDLLRTLITFLESVTILSFHLEDDSPIGDDSHHHLVKNDKLIDALLDVLTQLLAYLQKYVISLYVEFKFKPLELVVQTYIDSLFQSSLHILSKSRLIPRSVIKSSPVTLLLEDANKSIESPSAAAPAASEPVAAPSAPSPVEPEVPKPAEEAPKPADESPKPVEEPPKPAEAAEAAKEVPAGESQPSAEASASEQEEKKEEGEKKEESSEEKKVEEKKKAEEKKEETYEEYVLNKLENSVIKTLLPHLITSLVFFPKVEIAEMIGQLQSFLFGVDEINNLLFKDFVNKSEKEEYLPESSSNADKEKEKEKDNKFWLLEIERMTAALIGDFHYSIIRGEKETEEELKYKTIIGSELFSNGLVGALGASSSSSSSSNDENSTLTFLKQLANSEKNDICDHYYGRMENYAREKWLMVPKVDIEYPAFVKLLRILSAAILKHQGIASACMKVGLDRNSTSEVPKSITQLWDKLYQFREELFSQLTQKHPEILSTSDTDVSQEELYEKESNLLDEFLKPVIERCLFLFERIDSGVLEKPKTASSKTQSFKDLVSDIRRGGGISELLPSTPDILRRSAPPSLLEISSPALLRNHPGLHEPSNDENDKTDVADQITNLRGSVVVKKGSAWAPLASVLNNLRKFAWLENNEIKDKSSIIGQIISFVKDHQNDIQSIEKAMKQQQVRAQLRFEGLEKLVGLFFDKELIESVRLQLIKGSFHLLCKGESPVSIEFGISAAPKSLQQKVVTAAHKLYGSLLNFAKSQLKLCVNDLNTITDESKPASNSKVILTILLRALTVRFVPEDITVLISENLLDILVPVMNAKVDWKESPLKRSATRLFKCLLSIIGLYTDKVNQSSTLKTIQVLQELISTALNENNQSIRSYLDLTRRTSVNSTYRKYFTSKPWLKLLLNMALNLPKTTDKILALRNLEVILPTLPIEENIQEINNIIEKLFSSITVSFYQLKGLKKTSTSKKLLFDVSKSSRCKPEEADASKIILQGVPNVSGNENEEEAIAYSYGNVCFTSGTYAWEVKATSFKNEALGIGVGPYPLDSADEEKNIFVFPQRSSGCINLPDDHQNFAEGDVVKFKLTFDGSGINGILYFAVNDNPYKKISNNVQMNVYPIVIMATDQSYVIEFDNYSHEQKNGVAEMNGRAAGSDASYCQEVVELLRNLHKNINWSPFINSHIKENLLQLNNGYDMIQSPPAPPPQPQPSSEDPSAAPTNPDAAPSQNHIEEIIKTSNIFTKSFGVLKMIGGVDNGLRRGGLVDPREGLGTIQKIFSTSPVAKVLSHEGDNLSILDLTQLNPIERCSFSANSIEFDKDEIETLSQFLTINFNEESNQSKSFESQQFILSIFKTILTLIESENVRSVFYDSSFSIIIRKLLSISTTISPLKPVLSFSQLERTVFILYKTIRQQELQAKDFPKKEDSLAELDKLLAELSSIGNKPEEGQKAPSSPRLQPEEPASATIAVAEPSAATTENPVEAPAEGEGEGSEEKKAEAPEGSTEKVEAPASGESEPKVGEGEGNEEKKAEAPEGEESTDVAAAASPKKTKRVKKTAEEREAERKSRRLTRLFERLNTKLQASPLDEEIKEQILIAAKSDDQTEEGITEILSSLDGGDDIEEESPSPSDDEEDAEEESDNQNESNENQEKNEEEEGKEKESEESEVSDEQKFLDNYFTTSVKLEELKIDNEEIDNWINSQKDSFFTKPIRIPGTDEGNLNSETKHESISNKEYLIFISKLQSVTEKKKILYLLHKALQIQYSRKLLLNLLLLDNQQSLDLPIDEVLEEIIKFVVIIASGRVPETSSSDVNKLVENLGSQHSQLVKNIWNTSLSSILCTAIRSINPSKSDFTSDDKSFSFSSSLTLTMAAKKLLISNQQQQSLSMGLRSSSLLPPELDEKEKEEKEKEKQEKMKELLDHLAACVLSDNIKAKDRTTAMNLIATQCYSSRDSEFIKSVTSGKFTKILIDNVKNILEKQYKLERSAIASCSKATNSLFMQVMTAFAHIYPDMEIDLTSAHWQWFKKYKIAADATESFVNRTALPKTLILEALKKKDDSSENLVTSSETQLHDYEDNKKWTREMDEKLLIWQSKYPEHWKQPVEVFGFGKGDSGELGSDSGNTNTPTVLDSFGRLVPKAILGGERSSFLLTEEGNVYCTGLGDYGRLGVGDTDTRRELTQLPELSGVNIVKMHSSRGSYGSSLALDILGNLWSWGDGDYGKLGHGNRNQYPTPAIISAFNGCDIAGFHCGFCHSAAFTKDGVLFTWGTGDYGRLGHGDTNTYETPKPIEIFLGEHEVCGVCCGNNFTIVFTNNGQNVWTFGDGDYGKLGHGDTQQLLTPKQVDFEFLHAPFIKAESGEGFSLLLAKDGCVYSCGKGEIGSLGHGDNSDVFIYTLITELQGKNIIDISVGAHHCLALSKDGSVYSWGGNDNGQLGLGSVGNINTPTKIDLPSNCKIASICAGSNHSFLCTAFKDDSKLLPDHLPEEFHLLESVFNPQLIPRVKILNKFSEIVLSSISLFNLQTGGGSSSGSTSSTAQGSSSQQSISFGIDKVVGLLRYDEKFQILKRFISHSGNSQDYGPVIQLNRWLSEKKKSKSIFYQTSELLADVEADQLKAKRAWKVEFVGEAAIDAGGPFNESISQICQELQTEKVPIFQLTPNGKNNVGYNRDCIIPQPFHSQRAMKMFKFFGRLLGIGVRCHSPLQLKLPLPFWKSLLNIPLTVSDLKEIDETFVISHEYLLNLEQQGVDEENFELLPLEKFKPLTYNGKKLDLTFLNRKQYVKIAFKQKIKEWEPQVAAIRKGLDEMIPLSCLKLFTPAEIEILVCGKEELNLKLLKSVTNYCGYSSDSDIVQWLWEVLEHFSPEDQGLFLRFVSGKTRLPHSAADFSHQFEIHSLSRPVADLSLPIAATCFFKLSLPSYSSKEILEKKLLFAIRHCSLIDTDNTGNAIVGLDSDDEEEELL